MANMKPKSLLFFLLLTVVKSLDEICPPKCTCEPKNKKLRVDCRGKGLAEVFSQYEFPSQMKILDLSKNNISVIRKGFLDRHSQLERLYLRKNSITVLEEGAFIGLSFLNRLVLKDNKLVNLKAESFRGLPNLDLLDLSFNKIRSIDKLAFHGFRHLTKLILNNNSFKKIENGTFNSLKLLKKLGIKNVPLSCDCSLSPFIQYLTETTSLKKILGACFGRPTKTFSALRGKNLCESLPELSIIPKNDQVVAVGDSFSIVCNTTNRQSMDLQWTKNKKPFGKGRNIEVTKRSSKDQLRTIVYFRSARESDAGEYWCKVNGVDVIRKKINIYVVSSISKMCERESFKSDRRHLLWPITFAGSTQTIPCPTYGNDDKREIVISRTCTSNGIWGDVDFGNCSWIPLSQKLTKLLNLIKQEDFEDIAGITTKLRQLTYSSDFENHSDVSLTLNVIEGVIRKQGDEPFDDKVLDNMLAIFSNVMDVDSGILYDAQRRDRSPSRLAALLELISRRIVNPKDSRVFPNIVIGSVQLQKDKFQGETCNIFFKSKNPSLPDGVQCKLQKRKDFVVSIHIPKTIFEDLSTTGRTNESLEVQFLVYRNENLLPNVITNKTQEMMKGRNVSSSVLAIQMASVKELNLTEPLMITFATEVGTSPLISHFNFLQKVVGRPWSPNIDCHVNRSISNMTTVDCGRLVNKNLAIMSFLSDNIVDYPMEMVVYLGAIIASLFLLATLITFAVFRNLRYNRDDAAMLMNACLSLVVLVITFAFGIYRTNNDLVCLVVGILLHYFFLASVFWLISYIACLSRRMGSPKDPEENSNPVLQYYMVSWGVPAITCGITVASDLDNYNTSRYCWLTKSAGLGAFVGPACLLVVVASVFSVRLRLLLTRDGNGSHRPHEEKSEEERLHTGEPGVLEQTPDLDQQIEAEKSAVKLYLLATCVIMVLIYVNSIVAYFLIKSRRDKLLWAILSYLYALANVSLGASVFLFYCASRRDVRLGWRKAWKNVSVLRVNFGRWRSIWITPKRKGKNDQAQPNAQILLNGENIDLATTRVESDRQSNITLPSSAAMTNDVFVNGRPLSTARASLLDEADIPAKQDDQRSKQGSEVDLSDTGRGDGEQRRSQNSMHSTRRSADGVDAQAVASSENVSDLENPSFLGEVSSAEVHDENNTDISNTDITDGVTSKSESSAPTTVEVSLPQTSTSLDNSNHACPRLLPKLFPRTDTLATPSSSSLSEAPARPRPNVKRKRSSESLTSRNGSGSVGPRARKFPQLQSTYSKSSSSTFGEIAPKVPDIKGQLLNESINLRMVAPVAGTNGRIQFPKNRYKDGREKPEPKQWTGSLGPRIAYVPVPHVSKIHREPNRNETSV